MVDCGVHLFSFAAKVPRPGRSSGPKRVGGQSALGWLPPYWESPWIALASADHAGCRMGTWRNRPLHPPALVPLPRRRDIASLLGADDPGNDGFSHFLPLEPVIRTGHCQFLAQPSPEFNCALSPRWI